MTWYILGFAALAISTGFYLYASVTARKAFEAEVSEGWCVFTLAAYRDRRYPGALFLAVGLSFFVTAFTNRTAENMDGVAWLGVLGTLLIFCIVLCAEYGMSEVQFEKMRRMYFGI